MKHLVGGRDACFQLVVVDFRGNRDGSNGGCVGRARPSHGCALPVLKRVGHLAFVECGEMPRTRLCRDADRSPSSRAGGLRKTDGEGGPVAFPSGKTRRQDLRGPELSLGRCRAPTRDRWRSPPLVERARRYPAKEWDRWACPRCAPAGRRPLRIAQGHTHRSLVGVLERVADEVRDDPAEPHAVPFGLHFVRRLDLERSIAAYHPLLFDDAAADVRQVGQSHREGHRSRDSRRVRSRMSSMIRCIRKPERSIRNAFVRCRSWRFHRSP